MFTFKYNFFMMPSVLRKKSEINTFYFNLIDLIKYDHMFFKNYLNIDRNKNNLVITTYFTTMWTYIMKYNRIKIILQVNLKKTSDLYVV